MMRMRWLLAWTLFWIGHAVSRFDRIDREWVVALWMPIYQWSMRWSAEIQGEGKGPWGAR